MLSGGVICRLWYDLRRRCAFISAIRLSCSFLHLPRAPLVTSYYGVLVLARWLFFVAFHSLACLDPSWRGGVWPLDRSTSYIVCSVVFARFPSPPVHCVGTYAAPDMGHFSLLSFLSACLLACFSQQFTVARAWARLAPCCTASLFVFGSRGWNLNVH